MCFLHPVKRIVTALGSAVAFGILVGALASASRAAEVYAAPGVIFSHNLTFGSNNNDVAQLQAFLNSHHFPVAKAGPGSPGHETTYFGKQTKNALIQFQEQYAVEILKPLGLKKGTGNFAAGTRNYINQLSGKPTILPTSPVIALPSATPTTTKKKLYVPIPDPVIRFSGGSAIESSVSVSVSHYTIGGTVNGLTGTVVLQNNGGDSLTVNAAASFTFPHSINNGENYSVSILSQPVGQVCSLTMPSGTVTGANVLSVSVNCLDIPVISLANVTKNYGDFTFTFNASSTSFGVINYSLSNPAVATIDGSGIVTIVGAGTSTITAVQSAAANFAVATTTALLTVNPIAPTITFNAITKNFGDPSFSVSPSSNGGGSFSFSSNNSNVATVTGNMITIVGAGTSTITAVEAASTNYTGATSTALLVVNTSAPSITFNDITATYGDDPFALLPLSLSGGSFSFISSQAGVAGVTGNICTVVGVGTSTITAFQGALGNYSSASASALLTVNPALPTINFSPFYTFSGVNVTAMATSNSGGNISYSIANTAVATVSGTLISPVWVGGIGNGVTSTVVTANQVSTSNYMSRMVTTTLTVYLNVCTLTEPCFNGGSCTPLLDSGSPSYSCTCSPPYSGSDCLESDVNCNGDNGHMCLNSGVCNPTAAGGECACPTCWTGTYCDQFDTVDCA